MNKFIFALCFLLIGSTAKSGLNEDRMVALEQVQNAIEFAKKNGKEKLYKAINKQSKFQDGDIYVTVYDLNGKCLAHPIKSERVAKNQIENHDFSNPPIYHIKERVKIAKEKKKGWQKYMWSNPKSGLIQEKNVYLETYDDIIISAGAYTK